MFVFLIWVLCAFLSGILAGNRNRSSIIWFALGLLFGVFAVILIAVLPKVEK